MELKLTFEDLRSNALYVPCSLTKFEHFNHLAQAAIVEVGKGTYMTEDSYNVIYAPPSEVSVESPTSERPELSENPACNLKLGSNTMNCQTVINTFFAQSSGVDKIVVESQASVRPHITLTSGGNIMSLTPDEAMFLSVALANHAYRSRGGFKQTLTGNLMGDRTCLPK